MLEDKVLHITNGDSLTQRLTDLKISGDIATWREILCEGPATSIVFSEEFIEERIGFLQTKFGGGRDEYYEFVKQFDLSQVRNYDQIILWFEYDLFCHVNMAAVVSFLMQDVLDIPISLVCSGTIDDSGALYGLGELTNDQLMDHYRRPFKLEKKELDALTNFWSIYVSGDHRGLANLDFSSEVLPYLSKCISAHFRRFPSNKNGLNQLEIMVLNCIRQFNFKNEQQVVSWLLRHQEYYGFGDVQWENIVQKLRPYFMSDTSIQLSPEGVQLANGEVSAFEILRDDTPFGGSLKYKYFYDKTNDQLKPVS